MEIIDQARLAEAAQLLNRKRYQITYYSYDSGKVGTYDVLGDTKAEAVKSLLADNLGDALLLLKVVVHIPVK